MNIFHQKSLPAAGLILIAALLCMLDQGWAQAPKKRIAVVASHNAPPYEEAIDGVKRFIESNGAQAELNVYKLETDEANGRGTIASAIGSGANVLLTLGSLATRAALSQGGNLPTVAGLILDSNDLKNSDHATGVVLDFPLEIQFQWMTRILPGSRSIGAIFGAKNSEKMRSAEKIARAMGLTIYARQVENPSDIPDALEYLEKRIDVLWGVPDELVFTPQTAKQILLVSFRNRIPLVGISQAWVKAGALYSLDWDYADIGCQCAEMAMKVLQGVKPGDIPPAWPRKAIYSLNLKTALYMKIDIPEKLVQGAHQVFK